MNIKPPVRPGKDATQKALDAYHSELRRYAQRLAEFEQALDEREQKLAEFEQALDTFEDEEDCDCGPDEALEGCPCDTCAEFRENYWDKDEQPAKPTKNSRITTTSDEPLFGAVPAAHPTGDEVNWLESLYNLKDQRKA